MRDEQLPYIIGAKGKAVDGQAWGVWRYHASNLTLVGETIHGEYEIDLEEIHRVADVFIWVRHLMQKNWSTSEMISDLVTAFDALFKVEVA
jgi:hypothetical protein